MPIRSASAASESLSPGDIAPPRTRSRTPSNALKVWLSRFLSVSRFIGLSPQPLPRPTKTVGRTKLQHTFGIQQLVKYDRCRRLPLRKSREETPAAVTRVTPPA